MIVYAFDVDETLEISAGPVTLQSLMDLRIQGHIVGLCGNWACMTLNVMGWHNLISFVNCVPEYWVDGKRADKVDFLKLLKQHVRADDFVMVGNILGVSGASDDQGSAERAGWRFIKESDFAQGVR